jgi:hypothetical protein
MLAILLLALAHLPPVSAGDIVQFNGFAVDYYCWMLSGRRALDGARLGTNPGSHTTHCMRDVSVCIANGYMVVEEKVNGAYTYDLKYRFDKAGNDMMLSIVQTTSQNNNLRVTITGEEMPDNYIAVSSMILEPSISSPIGSDSPTAKPTIAPSAKPTTKQPSAPPSVTPSARPSPLPEQPTQAPETEHPSVDPTSRPTSLPSTIEPSSAPSAVPTAEPTAEPTTYPLIEGNGLTYPGKVATGVIVGAAGVCILMLSMSLYASRVDNGSLDPRAVQAVVAKVLSGMSCVMAVVSIVLIFEWVHEHTTSDINYLGKLNWKDNVFAYHPVLMTCFVMGQVVAVSVWSLIPSKSFAKLLHVVLQMGSLSCMIAAFVAIVKDRQNGKFATFTTIHSWVGVGAVCVYGLTFIWGGSMGIMTAFWPESALKRNIDWGYFHRAFAALTMGLSLMAITTGVMDRLSEGLCYYELEDNEIYGAMKDSADHYKGMPQSCKVVYGSVVAALVAASLMMWAVMWRSISGSISRSSVIAGEAPERAAPAAGTGEHSPTRAAPQDNKSRGGSGSKMRFQMVGVSSASDKVNSLQV